MNRRHFFHQSFSAFATSALVSLPLSSEAETLPLNKTFLGKTKFDALVAKAVKGSWSKLPTGQRMGMLAMEFFSTPYVGFTLEIDDKVEAPSVNLAGLDCWTFFETVLGLARMLESGKDAYKPADLLEEILWTRYRGGICTGSYLQRIHYLNEWWFDNEARGNVTDLTKAWGVEKPLKGRESMEMTKLWQSYRYLKNNPALRPKMAELETLVTSLPVHYIPTAAVAGIESKIQTGDILGIVSKLEGGVCSHVGLAMRMQGKDHPQIMHASSNFRKVVVEGRISDYLKTYTSHLGIIIARPLPVSKAIHDMATYRTNLKRLTGGILVE